MFWVYTKQNKVSVAKQSLWLQNKVFLPSRWRDVIIVGRQSTKPTNYKAPKAKPEKAIMNTTVQKKRWRFGFDSRPNHWVASKKTWPLGFYGQFGMDKNGRRFFSPKPSNHTQDLRNPFTFQCIAWPDLNKTKKKFLCNKEQRRLQRTTLLI